MGLGAGQLLQVQQEPVGSCCQLCKHQGILHLHSLLVVCWHQGQRRQDVPTAAATVSKSGCQEIVRCHSKSLLPIPCYYRAKHGMLHLDHSTGRMYLQQQQQRCQSQTVERLADVKCNSLLLWVLQSKSRCAAPLQSPRGLLALRKVMAGCTYSSSSSVRVRLLGCDRPVGVGAVEPIKVC